ncbi:hypothetical protein [Candidatus Binatus sp.]|uniref:hypothetical protein n=1 Tax=Candidatus Binatus sp. TaxID=2811406 RepID=UPI003CBDC9F1
MPRKKSDKLRAEPQTQLPPRGTEGSQYFVDPHPERGAVPSFRGYAYQAFQTIRAWLNCNVNEQILCEFGEDIATVQLDANGKISAVELDQIKHRQGSFTLRNDAVAKAMDSLLAHVRSNPNLSFKLRVSTISDRGNEQGIDWRYAACGLDLWDRIRTDPHVPKEAYALLRQFIKDQLKISPAVLDFVETVSDPTFNGELVSRIFWDTGDQSYSEIQSEIARLLAARPRPITERVEIDAVSDRLWRHVTERMANIEPEPLTKQELDEILLRETTASVDRETIRKVASSMGRIEARLEHIEGGLNPLLSPLLGQSVGAQISIGSEAELLDRLPNLPELCSSRQEVVKTLALVDRRVMWIHGWTGSGKSTLANLLVRASSKGVIWCNLHGLEEFSVGAKLIALLRHLQGLGESAPTIVCDDLLPLSSDTRTSEIVRAAITQAIARGQKLLVTSQGLPSSRFHSEFTNSMYVTSAPPLEENEILELLGSAGLTVPSTASTWANYLSATTGGHPQLVSARIVHARQQEWKLSDDELLKEPRTVDQVKAEARGLLADSIPSEESREMARRLSVVMGVFSRDFAINLGSSLPALKEPGQAFDRLVGPWIEEVGNKRFALSPLLGGYAAAEFGEEGLKQYNAIAVRAWLRVRTVTPAQILQIIVTALAAENEQLLTKISAWLVREPDVGRFAKQIALLNKICLKDDGRLSSLSIPARFIFRQAQLRVATLNSDWASYTALDRQVIGLLEVSTGQPFEVDFRLFHFVASNLVSDSPIPFSEKLSRAFAVATEFRGLSGREDLTALVRKIPIGDLIMTISTKAQTPSDLRYWIESLRLADARLRKNIFAAFDRRPESYSITIGHIWQRMSASSNPDWTECLSAFEAVREFGKQSRNRWLAAAAVRASMVVFDEFLAKPAAALQLASEARKDGCDHLLVDFGEVTIRYRSDDYVGALQTVDRAERRVGPRELPVEQLFALTYALRAAAALYARGEERIGKLERIVKHGEKISKAVRGELFGLVASIGFEAECAWLAHERGKYRSAVLGFMRVVSRLEKFPDQSNRLLRALRLRVGHALAWLSQGAAKTDMLETPYPGWFANLEEPIQELLTRPGAPYSMMSATLAEYAALVSETKAARLCVRLARKPIDSRQYYMGALHAADALFSCSLIEGKLQSAVPAGIDYARLLSLGGVLRKKESDWPPLTERIDPSQLYEAHKAEIDDNCAQNIPLFVLAPVLMAACAHGKNEMPDFHKWRRLLEATIGSRELVTQALDLTKIGLRAVVREDDDALEIARRIANDPSEVHEDLKMFSTIFGAGLKSASPRDALAYQASGLSYAARLRGSHWSAIFCRMIRHRWIQTARRQPFSLVAPRSSVQEILRAASPNLFGVPQCANLLIVAAQAVGARWSEEAIKQLKTLTS